MKVKVGIVGLGRIGERHLNAYSGMNNVEIRGLYDADDTLVKEHRRQYKVPFFDTLEHLLQSDIDAVDVCVPTFLHHEVVLKALEEGKNVFCEKPLTHKLEKAKEIKKKMEETGKMVMVGYLYRFHPSFKLLHEVLDKNIIGKPYYALFRLGGRGGHRAWKHRGDKGGGAMHDMLTHMLDLALFYFGEPVEVVSLFSDILLKERLIDGKRVQVDAEDCVFARMKTEGGVQVFLQADLVTPSFMNTVEVHGDNGSFFGSIMPRFPTILYLKEPRDIYDRGENIFNFPPVNLVERELRYFINCILNSSSPGKSVEESIRILEIIEELRRK